MRIPALPVLTRLCSCLLVAVVSGCSSIAPGERGEGAELRGIAAPVEDASSTARPGADASQAVVALLDQAEQQQSGGNPEQSAATLERALRIEPRNPWLWYRLAEVRLDMGMLHRAEQLALKSTSLAVGNPRLAKKSWLLIAQARERMGDSEGAGKARDKAAQP